MVDVTECGAVSVAVRLPFCCKGAGCNSEVQTIAAKLLDRMERQKIQATWAMVEPASCALSGILAPRGQEIALLADPAMDNGPIGRSTFVQLVIKRLQIAAQAGLQISTFIIDEPLWLNHIDLILKHEISATCGLELLSALHVSAMRKRSLSIVPADPSVQKVCFGLMHVKASAIVGGGSSAANRSQMRRFDRAIGEAVEHGGVCQLQVDLASLLSDRTRAMQSLDVLLASLAKLRNQGRIKLATVREIAGRHSASRRLTPAQSILRAA